MKIKMKEFWILALCLFIVGQLLTWGAGATGAFPPYGWSTFLGGIIIYPFVAYVVMKTEG